MLCYNRIDVSERVDINKTSASKECNHMYQPYVYNGCHDVLMMSMKLRDIAILNINGADYYCIITAISNIEAINLLQTIVLREKKGGKL